MIPLAVPNLAGREGEYLAECVRSTFVSTIGAFVTRFEEMVAAHCGARHSVATSCGTTGLHAALMAVGVERDDLVLLPSFTFIASANAVAHCGAEPWLVDIDPNSWTLDPELLAETLEREAARDNNGRVVHRASGRRVAAVMPVYTMGNTADMDAIVRIARDWGLPVVADAAAAHGAIYKGRPLGALEAEFSVLSFNGNKTVTAGGGGGVVTNGEALAARLRHLTTTARHGPGYDHDMVGYNYRLTNLQAAVGCAQMELVDGFVAAKRAIHARYVAGLGDLPDFEPFPEPDWSTSARWLTGAYLRGADDARMDAIRADLRAQGIDARPFWKPVHLQKPFLKAPRTPMPHTDAIWNRVLTLPCSTHLSEADQEKTIAATRHSIRATR